MNDKSEELRNVETVIEYGVKKIQAALTVLGACGYDCFGNDGDDTLYWFSSLLGDETTRIETALKHWHTKTA
jgi:hypothetical protein